MRTLQDIVLRNCNKKGMEFSMKYLDEIIKYFSGNIGNLLKATLEQNSGLEEQLQEIRIRVNRPILLKTRQADFLIEYIINNKDILQILDKVKENESRTNR